MSATASSSSSPVRSRVLEQHDDDIVIVSAVRSAITKGRKGGFKDTKPELILSHVLRAVYEKVNLGPKLIDDISVNNVLPPGGGASACSSGLTAVTQIANEIKAGQIEFGVGAGVESMTSVTQRVSTSPAFTPRPLQPLRPIFARTTPPSKSAWGVQLMVPVLSAFHSPGRLQATSKIDSFPRNYQHSSVPCTPYRSSDKCANLQPPLPLPARRPRLPNPHPSLNVRFQRFLSEIRTGVRVARAKLVPRILQGLRALRGNFGTK
ncbi:hypothetical protein D9611_003617 [Ephemerocybe angulata]|uniref:Thiolase N-terminal domain-containing protein n=1 Tax=Ephemerocybe angulata TaxID=980116 RepID=A0A8H5EZ43_9AGAR|nr:hypothetical protein D9611_003617 [Tulosesus angulatus]